MRELEKVLDQNEKVFWEGTPNFWPYLFGSSIATTIFGLIWMIFLLPFIGAALYDVFFGSHVIGFGIFFMPHLWIGIFLIFGIPTYQVLAYKHTYYAITDKRVVFQKGWIGRDFDIVDFDQITNAEVDVGVFDKIFKGNTGSIAISTAGSFVSGKNGSIPKPFIIRNVVDPYTAFRFLKKVSHDVKTDIQYPNKLRPEENPGYQTNYDPNKN